MSKSTVTTIVVLLYVVWCDRLAVLWM